MIRIGLCKGDAIHRARQVITAQLEHEINHSVLHHVDHKRQVYFYLMKPRDVPKLVHDGVLDAGITLEEWVEEKGYPLHVYTSLDWCNTRISLLAPPTHKVLDAAKKITCVTEFPNIASRFFESRGIQDYAIEHVAGSCEGFVPSIYDCAVDCVETGGTIRRHDLEEEVVILRSRAVLVTKSDKLSVKLKRTLEGLAL